MPLIATSVQLLAGLALEPKITSHPKTLDMGGKLWPRLAKLCTALRGSLSPCVGLRLTSLEHQGRGVQIQHCQRGLTQSYQQTSDAPGPRCATAHGHGVVVGISIPFIYMRTLIWENRAAASLSLA